MKILAVDDDELILSMIRSSLSSAGFRDVTTVMSAAAAISDIETTDESIYDCVLLDILMPGMDGIELCRFLKRDPRYFQVPIIMVTSKADKLHIDRAFAAGATDYITKPIDIYQLSASVRCVDLMKSLAEKNFFTSSLTRKYSKLEESALFDFPDRHVIDHVPGFLSYPALENYLKSLSRSGLSETHTFAFKIREAGRIYSATGPHFFRALIDRVAESLSKSMRQQDFFLSYAGEGCFSCVIRRHSSRNLQVIVENVNQDLRSTALGFPGNYRFGVSVCMGDQFRLDAMQMDLSGLDAVREGVISAHNNALEFQS